MKANAFIVMEFLDGSDIEARDRRQASGDRSGF